ncbi:recombinase family protein [Aliarcobacter butzleri]|uniref:Recombinase family protein n=1 Tax=Aliarcobacter butzleri TaxID=28197 RepID=A0AAW7PZE5_9BACT|nr:recombinase family protein [Aliarcobacter butzleri]MCG3667139.1 recombinase family protein [Aliarcobacter butzleri]MDN5071060.1 recombinase family protein [Aliarcobacter butzleri]
MDYFYIKYTKDEDFVKKQKNSIKHYCENYFINIETNQVKKTTINKILKKVSIGDSLIIYDLSILGNTTYTILGEMFKILEKGITLIFTNYNDPNKRIYPNSTFNFNFLKFLHNIEKNHTKKRISLAQESCKKKGKKLGRKKNAKIKSIYDEHKRIIMKLYKDKVPKTKIIERIGIGTPQGLSKYINKIIEIKKIELNINKSNFDVGFNLLTKK